MTPWRADQCFNFFPVPTDIHFGFGVVRSLPERVRSFGSNRVFIVTDPGIRSAGTLDLSSPFSPKRELGAMCTTRLSLTPVRASSSRRQNA